MVIDDVLMTSDELPHQVRMVVLEFVRAGFRHVGILRGGLAALSPEQRIALVASDVRGVTVDASSEHNPSRPSTAAALRSMMPRLPSLTAKKAKAPIQTL